VLNLQQPTRGHEVLYAERSSKDEKLLIKPVFFLKQKYELIERFKYQGLCSAELVRLELDL
jgi:hypothetical protein